MNLHLFDSNSSSVGRRHDGKLNAEQMGIRKLCRRKYAFFGIYFGVNSDVVAFVR